MPQPVLAFPKEKKPRSWDPGLGFTLFQAPAASGALQAQQGGVVPVGRLWGVSRRGRIGCCADYMCRYGGRRRGQSARGEACTKETIAIARGACLYRNRLRSRLRFMGRKLYVWNIDLIFFFLGPILFADPDGI